MKFSWPRCFKCKKTFLPVEYEYLDICCWCVFPLLRKPSEDKTPCSFCSIAIIDHSPGLAETHYHKILQTRDQPVTPLKKISGLVLCGFCNKFVHEHDQELSYKHLSKLSLRIKEAFR